MGSTGAAAAPHTLQNVSPCVSGAPQAPQFRAGWACGIEKPHDLQKRLPGLTGLPHEGHGGMEAVGRAAGSGALKGAGGGSGEPQTWQKALSPGVSAPQAAQLHGVRLGAEAASTAGVVAFAVSFLGAPHWRQNWS